MTRFWPILRTAPRAAMATVVLAVVIAALGRFVLPHSPIDPALAIGGMPPWPLAGSDPAYPLGTDEQGRDILSRSMVGLGVSLMISAAAIGLAALVGTALGLLAGYVGAIVDVVVMRAVDVTLAFPVILIAIVLGATVGPSLITTVVILALIFWARYARVVRAEVLSLRERDFVVLARIAGASPLRIMLIHLLPNVSSSVLVLSTLQIGWAIIAESTLSFLGAGVPPPTPTLGGMVAAGQQYLGSYVWISVAPGVVIAALVLSFNFLGDWLRDRLDPQLERIWKA